MLPRVVVVTQTGEVQQRVSEQVTELACHAVLQGGGLATDALKRDGNVAGLLGVSAGERQHVGRGGTSGKREVQAGHVRIVGEAQGNGARHARGALHGGGDGIDETREIARAGDAGADIYL